MTKFFFLMTVFYTQSDTVIKKQEFGPNRLIHATSPYLRQHAYNPVDWYEWGQEALDKAKQKNLPLLVSIGYAACHWCHVMAHESFEDQEVANLMNQHFINIKIDREERPDIDRIYMDAVQAMGINGGWPLNVFLTSDQKPFYGGTYFSKKHWIQTLTQLAKAYQNNRSKIDESADKLTAYLQKSTLSEIKKEQGIYTQKGIEKAYNVFATKFDSRDGGLQKTPKFPMPSQWLFLLRYHFFNRQSTNRALTMTTFTLKKMAQGGIYDQMGGGFSRYSVDGKWFAPHFEKMLYDNAQLMSLYSEAYTITHNPLYKQIVYETVSWLTKEMTHAEGGFYSSLDADSEGEEGEYYVWTKKEFDEVLTGLPDWVGDYYHVTKKGNWERGRNILFITENQEEFISKKNIDAKEFISILQKVKVILHKKRAQRIRPGTDDKMLAGWNAMMVCGLVDAYRAFGEDEFLITAKRGIRFIETKLKEGKIYRSFREKRTDTEGFLEDYAWVIRAYITLYQVTFDERNLEQATYWTTYVENHFFDQKEGFFYFSADSSASLITRKKEVFDNVIPCSNSVMARNLYHLGTLLDRKKYIEQAEAMVARMRPLIESQPLYMSNWGILYIEMLHGLNEVAIVGDNFKGVAKELQKSYTPFSLFMGTNTQSDLPLLQNKTNPSHQKATIYVCRDKVCKLPVHTVKEAITQILSDQF